MGMQHKGGKVVPFHGDHHPVSIYEGKKNGITSIYTPSTSTAEGTTLQFGDTYNDKAEVAVYGESTQKQGYAVDFNQLVQNGNFATTDSWVAAYTGFSSLSIADGVATLTCTKSVTASYLFQIKQYMSKDIAIQAGHKYAALYEIKPAVNLTKAAIFFCGTDFYMAITLTANTWNTVFHVVTIDAVKQTSPDITFYIYASCNILATEGDVAQFKNVMLFDLTQMFGAGHEPSTYEEFKAMFPDDYYAYTTSDHKFLGTDYETAYVTPSPDYPQDITSITSAKVESHSRNLADKGYSGSYSWGFPRLNNLNDQLTELVQTAENNSIIFVLEVCAGQVITIKDYSGNEFASVGWNLFPKGLTSWLVPSEDNPNAITGSRCGMKRSSVTLTVPQDGTLLCAFSSVWSNGKTNLRTIYAKDCYVGLGSTTPNEIPEAKASIVDLTSLLGDHELRSLPDGTRDELWLHRDGSVELVQRVEAKTVSTTAYVGGTTTKYAYAFNGSEPSWYNPATGSESTVEPIAISDRYKSGGLKDKCCYRTWNQVIICDNRFTDLETANTILADEKPTFLFKVQTPQITTLGTLDQLNTFYDHTTIYEADGKDITASVKVIE